MMKKNLHSHTQFCDGRSTMAEMVAVARHTGFDIWGFSPHAPISIPSPCNMSSDSVSEYMNEVARLRSENLDIKLLAGMEVDFLNEKEGHFTEKVAGYGLDYVIASVHFIPDRKGVYHDIDGSPERFAKKLVEVFDNDLDYVVRTFLQQTLCMIECHRPGQLYTIIGHIDKIARNASTVNPLIEQQAEYRRLASEVIDKALASDMVIEINTKQRKTAGRFFPHPRYWLRIVRANHPYIFSSDAHHVDSVDAGLDEARRLLAAMIDFDNCDEAFIKRDDTMVFRELDSQLVAGIDFTGITQLYASRLSAEGLERLPENITVDYDLLFNE